MTATVDRSDIDDYVSAVADLLADLDDDERDEVLGDVRLHAAEVSAETGEPLVEVLGPPERFAAELRTAAGLDPVAHPVTDGWTARLRRGRARFVGHRWVQPVAEFLPELRPAWWVTRGWLLAVVLAAATGAGTDLVGLTPVPAVAGSRLLGLVVAAALVVASVRAGRRGPESVWRRRALIASGVVAVVGAWMLLVAVLDGGARTYVVAEYVEVPPDFGTSNVYAFLPDGTPIEQFLLFDDQGEPFELDRLGYSPLVGAEYEAVPMADLDGRPVTNLYPRDVRFHGSLLLDEAGHPVEQDPPPPIVAIPRLVG